MDNFSLLILLMTISVVFVECAIKWGIPYPLTLVVGGALLGFVPAVEFSFLEPDIILVLVLPPALYYAAYNVSFKDFKKNLGDILWLALGLVAVTTLLIGIVFKWLFPQLPWALAFTFGAIISPPDAIAATTILKRFSVSNRLRAVLEGESLINDASGLVLYRFAVISLLWGSFNFTDASAEFIIVVIGGLAIGFFTGTILHYFSSRFFQPALAVAFSFVIPYISYILADTFGFSGVLSVVTSGLIGSRMFTSEFSSQTRVIGWATWDIFIILLNCFIFILMGLQLHGIIERLSIRAAATYLFYAFIITFCLIGIRFLLVLMRRMIKKWTHKKREQFSSIEFFLLSWLGIRGFVSLAIALALPYHLPDGSALPGRDIVLFLTFAVIFLTLLLPGLTLKPIMKKFYTKKKQAPSNASKIRQQLIHISRRELEHLHSKGKLSVEEFELLGNYFQIKHKMLDATSQNFEDNSIEKLRLYVVGKKHSHLLELWNNNVIDDHLFRLLESELDIEMAQTTRSQL